MNLSQKIIIISPLALFHCPDLKDVELGSTNCKDSGLTFVSWFPNTWDGGQICLPGCLSRMNENNWETACCGALQRKNGVGTHCVVQGVNNGIVRPGIDGKKAVQCKGTLKCFQIRTLKISKRSSCVIHF